MLRSELPDQAKSLTEAVVMALRADIMSCRLMPGMRLKIGDLCSQFGVSLGAVREALSHLTAEGLVVAEAQRGFQVAPVSAAELQDLTRTRIEIEGLALRQAIAEGDIGWETGLVAAYHRLTRTPPSDPSDAAPISEAWSKAHADFHAALVAGCGSPWMMRLRTILYAQTERYRRLSVPAASHDRDVGQEHRELFEATLARDADAAVACLTRHLSATTRILLAAPEITAVEKAASRK